MTERVSSGIISVKRVLGLTLTCCALAACMQLAGCAEKGSPVTPDGESGFRIVSTLPIAGYAEHVQVSGGLCVMAAGQGGLVLVDVSDPAAPSYLGTGPTSYSSTGCAYAPDDSIAFVTNGTSGILAFDVSDPEAPVQIPGSGQGQQSRDVAAVEVTTGERYNLFVADGLGGFQVLGFVYLEAYHDWFFQPLGHWDPTGSARGVCLAGDVAIVAAEQLGLWFCDITDVNHVTQIGAVDTPGEARAVCAADGYAYVADWRAGLQVVDISDPANPTIVGEAGTVGNAVGVCYQDGLVFVADHVGGVRVFDVSDPGEPVEIGHIDTPFANDVFVTDGHVYVADRDLGLVIAEEE